MEMLVMGTQVATAQYLMREQHINPGRVDRDGRNALMHAAAGAAQQVHLLGPTCLGPALKIADVQYV